MDKRIHIFLKRETRWKDEMTLLRELVMACDLSEDFKWMHPCYTVAGKNVVLIHGFKDYCALLFHKGALLKDPQQVLVQQTENTRAARQLRFTNVNDIQERAVLIKDYINEAIAIEKQGTKVELKKTSEYPIPEELLQAFKSDPEFEAAFHALTPGRQRGYLLHFGNAKQSKTREARIEKAKINIVAGKGYNER